MFEALLRTVAPLSSDVRPAQVQARYLYFPPTNIGRNLSPVLRGKKIICPGPVVVGLGAAPHAITVLQTAPTVFCRRGVFKLGLTSTTWVHQGAVGIYKGDTGLSRPWSSHRITGIFVGALHGLHTQKLHQSRSRETSLPWLGKVSNKVEFYILKFYGFLKFSFSLNPP